jgi:hypothetical protein
MNGNEQRVVDALRMLWAAVDAEMAEKQLDSEEDVIGIPTTLPRGNLSSARYDAAIELLEDWQALERDAETDEIDRRHRNIPGMLEAFKIRSAGIELLSPGVLAASTGTFDAWAGHQIPARCRKAHPCSDPRLPCSSIWALNEATNRSLKASPSAIFLSLFFAAGDDGLCLGR